MIEIDSGSLRWFQRSEALHLLRRNVEIFQTGAVQGSGPLCESARIEFGINADELCKFTKSVGRPITASHDIAGPDISDVSGLVNRFRNTIVHTSTTENKNFEKNVARMSMNLFIGKTPNAIVINGNCLGCPYDDDIAINFGPYIIFVIRHLLYVHNFVAATVAAIPEDRRGESIPRFSFPALTALGV